MATSPLPVIVPTVNGAQTADQRILGLGLATPVAIGESTGNQFFTMVFELNGLQKGDLIGAEWGTPTFPPAGSVNVTTLTSVSLELRPK